MAHVDIPSADYAANHRAAVKKAKAERSAGKEPHNDVPETTPVPLVKRYENVSVRCTGKRCPEPDFTASFDEIIREVACPACGRLTPTPRETWGQP